jgi:hypothetical protein
MIDNIIIIDNCIDDIDSFRKRALELNYTKSDPNSGGWKGYRCLEETDLANDLIFRIGNKLSDTNTIFKNVNYRYHFHCSLLENNTDTNKIHKDSMSDYAGVLYMTPNPSDDSGTSFYNDTGNIICYLNNIYNRLVMYPSNIWHSVNSSFGNSLEDGRLTFTIFCSLIQKNSNSII